MLIWIIGLSGSGKTTLANEVARMTRKSHKNVVVLDGDDVRTVFQNDLGYSIDDRKANASRLCRLGKFLSEQGIIVITPILSISADSRAWNRQNVDNYFEIYIDSPMEALLTRDTKGLYGAYTRGEKQNVVGMDINFIPPEDSDLVIKNDKSLDFLLSHAESIAKIAIGKLNVI